MSEGAYIRTNKRTWRGGRGRTYEGTNQHGWGDVHTNERTNKKVGHRDIHT